MAKFAYEALDSKGKIVTGVVDAPNVESAIESLHAIKYTVTNVKQQQQDIGHLIKELSAHWVHVKAYALVVFTRQLATIFNAGIPLLKGLEGLQKQTIDRKLSECLAEVYGDVKSGMALSRAMAKHPDVFTQVYLAMIRAGETAGALGEILDRLAVLLERDYNLRKHVQSAMTYPIFIFVAAFVIVGILVTYIFPTFTELLQGMQVELPLPTKILIFITDTLGNPITVLILLAALVIGGWFFSLWLRTQQGRRAFDAFLIFSPIIGPINKKVALSRFCRTLGTLLASGVPMVHSLEVVGKVSGNEVIADIVEEIKKGLRAGMRLSQPMKEYGIFPPMLPHMVAVGEETGSLSTVLDKLANFYDQEVEHLLNIFGSLIEPIMIFFMGAIVGFVVLAVFLPVYTIIGKF